MKIIPAAALAVAALASVPAPASAQSGAQRIIVSYADLDLGRAEDRARLDLRLLHAARTLCGTASPADPQGDERAAACLAEVRAAADSQLRSALARAQRTNGPRLASGR